MQEAFPRDQSIRARNHRNRDHGRQRFARRGMPDRDSAGQPSRRALHRAHRDRDQRRQHLQGSRHQRRVRHPGRLHRLRRGPGGLPAHLRSAPAVLPRREADRACRQEDPAAFPAAHPERTEARPGGARPGPQGGRRHQGPDTHQLPLGAGPPARDDARNGPRRRFPKGRRPREASRDARHPRFPEAARRLRLHSAHRRVRQDQGRAEQGRGVPQPPLEGHGQADQDRRRAVRAVHGVGSLRPDDPRHPAAVDHGDHHRFRAVLRSGEGPALRGRPAHRTDGGPLPRPGADLPRLRYREADRPHSRSRGAVALGRQAGDRADRGAGRHRRQLRPQPPRFRQRDQRLQDQLRGR